MATNNPWAASVVSVPLDRLRSRTPSTEPSPSTSTTSSSKRKVIFGFDRARSCMIRLARNSRRRWTTVTRVAKLVRKRASSIAESPPPTRTSSLPLKKKPSQVAQAETPWPRSRSSDGRPSHRALAPVATITESARSRWSGPASRRNGRPRASRRVSCASMNRVPNRAAWRRIRSTSSGPWIPSGKPGKFSTSVVIMSWPPAGTPEITTGRSSARAQYRAAVNPAGPLPTIATGVVSSEVMDPASPAVFKPPSSRGGPGSLRGGSIGRWGGEDQPVPTLRHGIRPMVEEERRGVDALLGGDHLADVEPVVGERDRLDRPALDPAEGPIEERCPGDPAADPHPPALLHRVDPTGEPFAQLPLPGAEEAHGKLARRVEERDGVGVPRQAHEERRGFQRDREERVDRHAPVPLPGPGGHDADPGRPAGHEAAEPGGVGLRGAHSSLQRKRTMASTKTTIEAARMTRRSIPAARRLPKSITWFIPSMT